MKKIYTALIILFPILSIYSIGLYTITIADFIMIVLSVAMLFSMLFQKGYRKVVYAPLVVTACLIIIHMLFVFILNGEFVIGQITLRTLRFSFYIFNISIFIFNYFDLDFGYKMLKKTTLFATFFLFVQYIGMKIFGIYISGFIPGIPLIKTNYRSYLYDRFYVLKNLNRPYSIFEEPSHYAVYVILYFSIALFSKNKKELPYIFLVLLGIVLSKSAAGYIMVIAMLTIYMIKLFIVAMDDDNAKKKLNVVLFAPMGIIFFTQTNIYAEFMNRFKFAFFGRFENFFAPFLVNINDKILIGSGMVELDIYLPAISRILLFFGIIGFFFFLILTVYIFQNGLKGNRVVIFLLIVSTMGTEILFGKFVVTYLAFIIIPFISLPIER